MGKTDDLRRMLREKSSNVMTSRNSNALLKQKSLSKLMTAIGHAKICPARDIDAKVPAEALPTYRSFPEAVENIDISTCGTVALMNRKFLTRVSTASLWPARVESIGVTKKPRLLTLQTAR